MVARDQKSNDNQSVSEADDHEVFKKVVEQTASAEALLAVHNAQNMASKMTSISLNGTASRIEEEGFEQAANQAQGNQVRIMLYSTVFWPSLGFHQQIGLSRIPDNGRWAAAEAHDVLNLNHP